MRIKTDKDIAIKEYFAEEIKLNANNIIAAKVNNFIVSLNYLLKNNDDVTLLDLTNKEGMRVYINGLLYIMGKAFYNLYPEAKITVQHNVSNTLYCDIINKKITDKLIAEVEKEMKRIVEESLDIIKIQMTKEEAKNFYKETGSNRGELQLYAKEKEKVSLHYCQGYYNYFYGIMPISTSFMKVFKLEIYENSFVIRYPNSNNPKNVAEKVDNTKLLRALHEYECIHKDLGIDTIHKLNTIVSEGKIKDTILLAEALQEKKIAEIANKVLEKKKVKMVLIAGPSSSGKTTFAKRLGIQLRLNGFKPVTISVDNYFLERDKNPKDEKGNYNFETIRAIDLELFNKHILALLNGETIQSPTFNFATGNKEYHGETMSLKQDEILVIEGIHCLNDELTSSVPKNQKYKIYVSALAVLNVDYYNRISTTDSRLIRRIVRDHQFRGYSASNTLKIWPSVTKGEKENIFPYQEEADSMFNSALVYEMGVLKTLALPLLKEIRQEEEIHVETNRLYDFLRYFEDIPTEYVPKNSLLREFIGGGDFE